MQEHEGGKKKTRKCDLLRMIDGDRERLAMNASRPRMVDKFIRVVAGMRQKRGGRVHASVYVTCTP